MGDRLSISSTWTRFFKGRGGKKKVSPSSSCIAEENSGSSSSSPRWAIWYRALQREGLSDTAGGNYKLVESYWLPNSDAQKRKPVFSTHMEVAIGRVSKYLMRISVTTSSSVSKVTLKMSPCSVWIRKKNMCCGKEELVINTNTSPQLVRYLCLVGGAADKEHTSLCVIQVILTETHIRFTTYCFRWRYI